MSTTAEVVPLTVSEAAVRMRLSRASVYALCRRQKLRHQRVGVGRGKIVIPPDAVEEYLAAGTVPAAGPSPAAAGPPGPLTTFGNLDTDRLLEAWKRKGAV